MTTKNHSTRDPVSTETGYFQRSSYQPLTPQLPLASGEALIPLWPGVPEMSAAVYRQSGPGRVAAPGSSARCP